jgi:hypothetical protein
MLQKEPEDKSAELTDPYVISKTSVLIYAWKTESLDRAEKVCGNQNHVCDKISQSGQRQTNQLVTDSNSRPLLFFHPDFISDPSISSSSPLVVILR